MDTSLFEEKRSSSRTELSQRVKSSCALSDMHQKPTAPCKHEITQAPLPKPTCAQTPDSVSSCALSDPPPAHRRTSNRLLPVQAAETPSKEPALRTATHSLATIYAALPQGLPNMSPHSVKTSILPAASCCTRTKRAAAAAACAPLLPRSLLLLTRVTSVQHC